MGSLTAAEERPRARLRFFAGLFGIGALVFLVRPAGTVADLNRARVLFGLPPLEPAGHPVEADF